MESPITDRYQAELNAAAERTVARKPSLAPFEPAATREIRHTASPALTKLPAVSDKPSGADLVKRRGSALKDNLKSRNFGRPFTEDFTNPSDGQKPPLLESPQARKARQTRKRSASQPRREQWQRIDWGPYQHQSAIGTGHGRETEVKMQQKSVRVSE
ncbi:MAG: hypothetical protein L6R41_001592 [Letrouitia leprolyta]|nr:MAG: hypothetical protein L6R41_001592 [Letrouitia leprolyta]